jgi:quinol monooxygenase YgiN
MIILAVTMTIDPELVAAFEKAVAEMVGKVREEDGCHHYSLLAEDRAAGLINVVEIWRDESALRVHLAQPWIAEFLARFSPHIRAMNVLIYNVAGTRPLEL